METEEELVEAFAEKVHKIIALRRAEDEYMRTGNSTFRGEVHIEVADEINRLTTEANLVMVMLDDMREDNPSGFVDRLKKVLKDLTE